MPSTHMSSSRPRRSCRSIGAIELLRGADIPPPAERVQATKKRPATTSGHTAKKARTDVQAAGETTAQSASDSAEVMSLKDGEKASSTIAEDDIKLERTSPTKGKIIQISVKPVSGAKGASHGKTTTVVKIIAGPPASDGVLPTTENMGSGDAPPTTTTTQSESSSTSPPPPLPQVLLMNNPTTPTVVASAEVGSAVGMESSDPVTGAASKDDEKSEGEVTDIEDAANEEDDDAVEPDTVNEEEEEDEAMELDTPTGNVKAVISTSEALVDQVMLALYAQLKPHKSIADHFTMLPRATGQGIQCKHCKQVTKTRQEFLRHYREKHDPNFYPWKCPICDFMSLKKVSVAYHMNQHADKKPFECHLCGKGFGYKQKFKLHMKYHNDIRDQTCPHCLKSFHEKKTLTMHILRRHEGATSARSTAAADVPIEAEPPTSLIKPASRNPSHESAGPKVLANIALKPPIVTIESSTKITVTSTGTQREVSIVLPAPVSLAPTEVLEETDMVSVTPRPAVISKSGMILPAISGIGLNTRPVDSSRIITTFVPPVDGKPHSGTTHEVTISTPGPDGTATKKKVFVITKPEENKSLGSPVIIGTTKTNKRTNAYRKQLGLDPLPNTEKELLVSSSSSQNEIDVELKEFCTVAPTNSKRPNIVCRYCSQLFHSGTSFAYHLSQAHRDRRLKPYKCTLCNYAAKIKGNLEQHVKFHSDSRPFVCNICQKGFIQKYKLDLHVKSHVNLREWKCVNDGCDSAFNDKQDLNRHIKNVHFEITEAVFCDICKKAFKNQRTLEQHMHTHTGLKEFQCSFCNKLYSTRESLRSHEKGHRFEFGCEICSKPLGSYSAFIAHKRLHDPNQKGFPCDICGKVLPFQATLTSHKLTVHSDKRPYECEVCHKSFKTKGQLTNHKITHTKNKPYTCNICGYSVKRKDSLKLHMFRHANVKPFRCGRCGKEYTQKQALEIHLRAKHAGVASYGCSHCSKGFNTNYLLKKHLAKAHGLEEPTQAVVTNPIVIAQQEDVRKEEDQSNPNDKQTVLINAQVCEHCQEIFVSQHGLAVHILNDHMHQNWRVGQDGRQPEETGEGIADTIEIPMGEEMVIVQPDAVSDTCGALLSSAAVVNKAAQGTPAVTTASVSNAVSILASGLRSGKPNPTPIGISAAVTSVSDVSGKSSEPAQVTLEIISVAASGDGKDKVETTSSVQSVADGKIVESGSGEVTLEIPDIQ